MIGWGGFLSILAGGKWMMISYKAKQSWWDMDDFVAHIYKLPIIKTTKMTENFYRNGNRQAFDSFREQYSSNNFDILKENLLKNSSALLLFQNCNLIFLPKAEQLIDCCMKDDYINITTYCQNFSPSELEKKNDYLHFSSLILLNEWTESYLPKYLKINSSDPKTRIMQDSIWIRVIDVCKRLGEIYDELEKNYK